MDSKEGEEEPNFIIYITYVVLHPYSINNICVFNIYMMYCVLYIYAYIVVSHINSYVYSIGKLLEFVHVVKVLF